MKWNGTVAQLSARYSIQRTLARANTPQPISTQLLRSLEPIPDIPHGLDDVGAELGAQAPDADVHDVGARVERAVPGLGEQLLAGHVGAATVHEPLQQEELAGGERHGPLAD